MRTAIARGFDTSCRHSLRITSNSSISINNSISISSSSTRTHTHTRCFHAHQLVGDALREAREQLQRTAASAVAVELHTLDVRDAKPLVAHALTPPLHASNDVFLHLDRQLTHSEARTLADSVARRCCGEPLAYITGMREFWSLAFAVTPSTLIPRSDSEVLIETLVELYPQDARLHILDVGTGSGCLLIAALTEFPNATGVALDVSCEALAVAANNAKLLGVADRATFVEQDLQLLPQQLLGPSNSALFQQFDVVLSNPPYIPQSELHLVAPDVFAHEPHLALFAGGSAHSSDDDPQGLRMYRYLQLSVTRLLAPRSHERPLPSSVVLEVGSEAQALAVRELFASSADTAELCFERFLIDAQHRHRGLLLQQQSYKI